MSTPLATIFHGDVTLEQGSDITQFGWGDLNVNRRCYVSSTEDSVSNTDGALIVSGGVGISKTLNVHENVNVLYGVTRLTETHISTNNGTFTVTGGNSANIQVGDNVQFASTGGNVTIESYIKTLKLYGGLNSSAAIDIQATNSVGGISLLSGQSGNISIVSGSGGISGSTSNGNMILTANNASSSIIVNSEAANQNLSINLNGSTDSQLQIVSSGDNTTNTALILSTSNTLGNIVISNANGLGNGSITNLVGSGGFNVLTNTSGPISITAQGASASCIVNSNGPNQNVLIAMNNSSDSSLILQSEGVNSTNNAIQIKTTNTNGNISIEQIDKSKGQISIYAGSMGFFTTTQTGGSIQMTAYGSTSLYTNNTNADFQDLTISVTGNTNSKVNIVSTGTGSGAITLETTTNSGGIYIHGQNSVQIESNYNVQIATNIPNTPVYIGTPNSTTTIYGNLDVKGLTTTIESTVVTINDNVIVVNNAPSGTSNGGLAVKRYQSANNGGFGDVVSDIPDETGNVQNVGNTSTTIHLSASSNIDDNYYAGWWVKITDGTGKDQVRRIKSYSGSTKIATLYTTSDQIGVLDNPTPITGMDFSTIPDNTSSYSLYPCEFVMMIWDETHDEFAFVCSSLDPATATSFQHYSDLHINNLVANNMTINNINGSQADITIIVTLNNNTTTPVTISSFPKKSGVYMVFVKPVNDDSRTHAIFSIGRVDAINIPGSVIRLLSVKGVYNDQLDIQWAADSLPQLLYRPFPNGIGGTTDFKLKITSL